MKVNWNSVLKTALGTAEAIAAETIPGSGPLIRGVKALLDKDDANNASAIEDVEQGVVGTLTTLDTKDVKDPVLLQDGVEDLHRAFVKIKKALGR